MWRAPGRVVWRREEADARWRSKQAARAELGQGKPRGWARRLRKQWARRWREMPTCGQSKLAQRRAAAADSTYPLCPLWPPLALDQC